MKTDIEADERMLTDIETDERMKTDLVTLTELRECAT